MVPHLDLNSLDAGIASANKQLQQFCHGKLLFTRHSNLWSNLIVGTVTTCFHSYKPKLSTQLAIFAVP